MRQNAKTYSTLGTPVVITAWMANPNVSLGAAGVAVMDPLTESESVDGPETDLTMSVEDI